MLTNINDFLKKNWKILLIGVVFVAIRLINISSEEYWYDEYYNLLISYKLLPADIIEYVKHVFHPPFYYLLLSPILKTFGISEFVGRLPSVIFSLVAFVFLTKTLWFLTKNKITLFMGVLLFTFSSLNIEYSQEARPYSLLLALYSFNLYLVITNLQNRHIDYKKIICLSLLNILGLYTHYLYIVYFSSLLVSVVIYSIIKRSNLKVLLTILCSLFVSVLFFLPWIPKILENFFSGSAYYYIINKPAVNLLLSLTSIIYFYFIKVNILLLIVTFILVTFIFIRLFYYRKWILKNNRILFLVINLFVSLMLFYFSPLRRVYSFTWQRHIIIINYLFILILSVFVNKIVFSRNLNLLIFLLIFTVSSVSSPKVLKNDTEWFYNHQNKKITFYLENNEEEGDLILVPKITFNLMILRYYKGHNVVTSILNDEVGANGLPEFSTADLIYSNDKNLKIENYLNGLEKISGDYSRIWIVNNYSEEDDYALKYFRENPNWKLKSISVFPNDRLWLLTKQI